MDKAELLIHVRQSINARIAANRREYFTPADIKQDIEISVGQPLNEISEADVKQALESLWGSGIEPKSVGGGLWGAGDSKPPTSREIRSR